LSFLLYTVLLLVGAAGGVLLSHMRRRAPPLHGQLTISLGDKLGLVARYAGSRGLSVEAWASRTLLDAVPPAERRRAASPQARDAAFAQLDSEDTQPPLGGPVFGLPPQLPEAPPTEPPRLVPNHSCANLIEGPPRPFTSHGCLGSCAAPSNRNSPCFWPAGAASRCRHYSPRVRPSRIQLRPPPRPA